MVFLVLNVSILNNLVVCVHQDGQMAVEAGIGNICGDAYQASGESGQTQQALQYQKTCVDVPLSDQQPLTYSAKNLKITGELLHSAAPSLTTAGFIAFAGFLTTGTSGQMPKPPPLKPKIHRFLSTVVLLT